MASGGSHDPGSGAKPPTHWRTPAAGFRYFFGPAGGVVGVTLSTMASETCRGIDAARVDSSPPANVVAAVVSISGSIRVAPLPSSPSGIEGSGALWLSAATTSDAAASDPSERTPHQTSARRLPLSSPRRYACRRGRALTVRSRAL